MKEARVGKSQLSDLDLTRSASSTPLTTRLNLFHTFQHRSTILTTRKYRR